MLQIGAQALGLQRRPDGKLMHARTLRGPALELIRIGREALLGGSHDVHVVEEHDGAVGGGEAGELGFGGREGVGGEAGAENGGCEGPELAVLDAEEEDEACGLRVEA